jgi:hypothetical protein
LSVAKVVTGLTLLQDRAAGRFAAKSSSFPAGERIFRQNLAAAIPDTFLMLPKQIPSIPAPLRHKKKVKGYEKRREK